MNLSPWHHTAVATTVQAQCLIYIFPLSRTWLNRILKHLSICFNVIIVPRLISAALKVTLGTVETLYVLSLFKNLTRDWPHHVVVNRWSLQGHWPWVKTAPAELKSDLLYSPLGLFFSLRNRLNWKFSQALLRFIMCITCLIAFLPSTLHAMPTHHALQRLYMLLVLWKGSEFEGSSGVVLKWVKHFFFLNPDIKTVWVFWVVSPSHLTWTGSPKDKGPLGRFILWTQGKWFYWNISFGEKDFCCKESPQ